MCPIYQRTEFLNKLLYLKLSESFLENGFLDNLFPTRGRPFADRDLDLHYWQPIYHSTEHPFTMIYRFRLQATLARI